MINQLRSKDNIKYMYNYILSHTLNIRENDFCRKNKIKIKIKEKTILLYLYVE